MEVFQSRGSTVLYYVSKTDKAKQCTEISEIRARSGVTCMYWY